MIDFGDVIPFHDDGSEDSVEKERKKIVYHPNSDDLSRLNPLKSSHKKSCDLRLILSSESMSSRSLNNIINDCKSEGNKDQKEDHLRKVNIRLKKERDQALSSFENMKIQQKQLCDDFQLLRDKYTDLKTEMQRILWDYIPNHCIDKINQKDSCFGEISKVDPTIFETSGRIGDYNIGELLGEGQFADVKLCTHIKTNQKLAVKVLQKSKVVTLSNLKRIQTEISVLKKLDHPNIVTLVNVIHSPQCIYVMTELGGNDLFDFFDINPSGVQGDVAREIVLGIVEPIAYLHSLGICHRDLKPENVLLFHDPSSSYHIEGGTRKNIQAISRKNIQICDFGQSAQNVNAHDCTLDDLCGSPGFFAPEMILGGERHNGIAADVWSIGCIMLELTRGHDEFCKKWMTCYDYELLQDEIKFETALNNAIKNLNDPSLNDGIKDNFMMQQEMANFLKSLLCIDPIKRLDSRMILSQPWLCCERLDKSIALKENEKELNKHQSFNEITQKNAKLKDETISCKNKNNVRCKDIETFKLQKQPQDTDRNCTKSRQKDPIKKTRFLRDSMSNRARKHFNANFDFITETCVSNKAYRSTQLSSPPPKKRMVRNSTPGIDLRLPPIDKMTPPLPKSGSAPRKKKGHE